ncbi:hypothetical protein ACLOJK_008109 [Asimina triloba]
MAGDGGDAVDAASPFLSVLRRRSSCRLIRLLPSFWMPWLPSLDALVGSDGAPYLGAPVAYGLPCTFSC